MALKIDSPDISHKSDAGGVRLNIGGAQAVGGPAGVLTAELLDAAADRLAAVRLLWKAVLTFTSNRVRRATRTPGPASRYRFTSRVVPSESVAVS